MASKLVELIIAWEQFSSQHHDQSVEQFCQYYVAQQKAVRENTSESDELSRKQVTGGLLRVMGRITSAFALYHRAAMAKTELPTADSFYYLNGLNSLGESRKTDLINYLFAEYTTGMEAINKLIQGGYMSERTDPADKRARLLALTEKGIEQLTQSYRYSSQAGEMVFQGIQEDDLSLCLSLLKPIEKQQSKLVPSLKSKDFDEMYKQIMGEK